VGAHAGGHRDGRGTLPVVLAEGTLLSLPRSLSRPSREAHDREYRIKRYPKETDESYEARREEARRTREPIDYKYFTGKVLKEYWRVNGQIDGLFIEAYGTFSEPHSGESIELGTGEVESYKFPEHSFDKLLVVEKKTERPKFEHDRIAERYDMGIVYSSGFATEALHEQLNAAEGESFQIFCWHDADPSGYNIARNIRSATQNMPLAIEIIDIGLSVSEALRIGCSSEPFASETALPHELRATLNDLELEYFEERRTRFEINGNPADERMAYVEEQLQKHGIRPKYVPPEPELSELVAEDFEGEISLRVGILIDRIVDKDAIVTLMTDELRDDLQLEDAEEFIRERFKQRPTLRWKQVVDREHSSRVWNAREQIEKMVREEILTLVTEAQDGDQD
jgi:hypothetical protein